MLFDPDDLSARPPAASVVLLHSSASSARQWDALARALRPSCRVVAIDFHGHGTCPPRVGPARESLNDDLALVEPLLAEPDGVHLVGHSYGGAVALAPAARPPPRVRSLAVFEPVLFRLLIDNDATSMPARQVFALVDGITAHLADGRPDKAARHFIDFWSGAHAWDALPQSRRQALAARMPTVLAHFHGLFAERLPPHALERLAMPTLCLGGADTVPATRRIGELLAERLPRAEHQALPGMGHLGPVTQTEAVNRRLLAFVSAQPARASDGRGVCVAA